MHAHLPNPPITDPRELRAYSDEHVAYELRMFFGAVAARNKLIGASRSTPIRSSATTTSSVLMSSSLVPAFDFANNARIEAFANHLRNLVTFLYPDTYPLKQDDVAAHHFLPGADPYSRWLAQRLALSSTLQAAKIRADKEMAHLTNKRIAGTVTEKEWDMVPLAEEIRSLFKTFVRAADPARLGSDVSAAIPAGTL